jgi:hypothetical protein
MRSATLPEKLGPATSLLAALCVALSCAVCAGCAGNHHVSPWGERPGPTLEPFLRPPDLAAELARVDAETASLGLTRTEEIRAELPPKGSSREAVLRAYEGRDVAGRKTHAVRVATPRGVVLAVGPLDASDRDRDQPTELVPALAVSADGGGAAFRSLTDLNGDGSLDVVLRNEAGALSIWRIGEIGSGPYAIRMVVPPTRGTDAAGTGRVDLWGELAAVADDPIAPRLTDVATFAGGAYSDVTPAARAWHGREAARPLPTNVSDAVRLRAAIEHAWHAVLAGQPQENVLRELRREPVPSSLRASFDAHHRRITALMPR